MRAGPSHRFTTLRILRSKVPMAFGGWLDVSFVGFVFVFCLFLCRWFLLVFVLLSPLVRNLHFARVTLILGT